MIPFRRFLALFLSAMLLGAPSFAVGQNFQEYQLKAGFILNFLRFSELPNLGDSIDLCVTGDKRVEREIRLLEGEKVSQKPIRVRHVERVTPWSCHVVFFPGDSAPSPPILFALQEEKVLTIGESPYFLEAGGVIRFFEKDRKIRFGVNLDAAAVSSISISSKMLRLAAIVLPSANREEGQ